MGIFDEVPVPDDLLASPPRIWEIARNVGSAVFKMSTVDGLIYGSGNRHINGMPSFANAILIAWNPQKRMQYLSHEIVPHHHINISKYVGSDWDNMCIAILLTNSKGDDGDDPGPYIQPDLSTIPFDDNDVGIICGV